MNTDNLLTVGGILIAGGTVAGALARWVVRPIWAVTHKANDFFDSWNGEPARDGLPARPGVVDRVIGLEGSHVELRSSIKVNGTGLKIGDAVALALRKVDEQNRMSVDVKTALEDRQTKVEAELAKQAATVADALTVQATTVRLALDDQATVVRTALGEHSTQIEQELKDVWRSLASRDIGLAADHLATIADRAERNAPLTDG